MRRDHEGAPLRAVVYHSPATRRWTAVVLERNWTGSGPTAAAAVAALGRSMEGEYGSGDPSAAARRTPPAEIEAAYVGGGPAEPAAVEAARALEALVAGHGGSFGDSELRVRASAYPWSEGHPYEQMERVLGSGTA